MGKLFICIFKCICKYEGMSWTTECMQIKIMPFYFSQKYLRIFENTMSLNTEIKRKTWSNLYCLKLFCCDEIFLFNSREDQ